MTTPRWYAIRTRSRAEKVVRDQVAQRGVEAFLPLMMRVSQWKDRRKRIEWPLFPGYCFARFTGDQQLLVLQSPGVVEIIGSALGRPEAIPDSEVAALQRVTSSHQRYDAHPQLELGMLVEVIRGPLIGLHGKLLSKPDGCRLLISVNLIGQGAAVHIDADDVTRFQPPDHVALSA
jgi:transcription antitermination factor NusG